MSRKVYLSLGSNMGNRLDNIQNAESLIGVALGKIISKSAYYETAPWGNLDQAAFINAVLLIETSDTPSEILIKTKEIERTLGKKKIEHWGPRAIDIDILLYSNWIVNKQGLVIPHPHIQNRNFVLKPLLDIEKNIMHPKLNKTIEELYLESPDQSEVTVL